MAELHTYSHSHTQKQTFLFFSGTDIYRSCSWTLWSITEASVYLRLAWSLQCVRGWQQGWQGFSVVDRAHVNITFHHHWPLSPSLMCLNQSGMRTNTQHASDIMEFPLLCSSQLRDSSFDISYCWLPSRGSPPTTPPDHRWTVESRWLCRERSPDSSKVTSQTVHAEYESRSWAEAR